MDIRFLRLSRMLDRMVEMVSHLKSEIETCQPTRDIHRDLTPRISLHDGNLLLNEYVIPLSTRPMTLRLIECFLDFGMRPLCRQEIMNYVYKLDEVDDCSPRMAFSTYQNMLKLMSRSRHLLRKALNCDESDDWIDFFVYDDALKKWRLFQLASDRAVIS